MWGLVSSENLLSIAMVLNIHLVTTHIKAWFLVNCAGPYPPPDTVHLVEVSPKQLIFTWNTVDSECQHVYFNISASNCGTCPRVSNSTTAICSNLQVSSTAVMCIFRVQSVVCRDIFGTMSNPVVVTLKGIRFIARTIIHRWLCIPNTYSSRCTWSHCHSILLKKQSSSYKAQC